MLYNSYHYPNNFYNLKLQILYNHINIFFKQKNSLKIKATYHKISHHLALICSSADLENLSTHSNLSFFSSLPSPNIFTATVDFEIKPASANFSFVIIVPALNLFKSLTFTIS
jgi:hypothetical protein